MPDKKRKGNNDSTFYRRASVGRGKVRVFSFFFFVPLCDDWVMTEMPYDLLLFSFLSVFFQFYSSFHMILFWDLRGGWSTGFCSIVLLSVV